jgi:ABC-type nitrate/sulfonate/bicarbonate transport system substrate-binding protein
MNIHESGATQKTFRFSLSIFALALCGLALLVGTSAIGSAAAAEMMEIKVGTQPYPGMASVLIGIKKGYFEAAGVKVIEQRMNSGRLTMDALLAGSIDIATPVETGVMFAISNGTELAILAQISTNPDEVKPVVRVASGVKTARDLRGKRLGYGAGSSNQFAMYNWMKEGGVSANEVEMVNLQPPDLVTSLVSNELDVAFIWEPFLTRAVDSGSGSIKIVEDTKLYQSRLLAVAQPRWAGQNTKVVSRFLSALEKSAQWIKDNRADAVKITASEIGMEASALDPIFDRWQFGVELPKALIDTFEAEFKWATTANLLPSGTQKPDFAKNIDPNGLLAINAGNVTYK